MREQAIPGCQPQEVGQEQINIADLFDAYLSSEYFNNHYSKNTQTLYSQNIRKLLKLSDLIGQLEADKLPELIREYAKYSKSPTTSPTMAALKSANAWGIIVGLIDGNPDAGFQPENDKNESPLVDFNISPLSDENLTKLMQAANKNPRNKALILTVLLTRANPDTVRGLTTESIITDENGTTTIAVNNFKIKVPEEAASVLSSYAKSLKPGPLFPSREKSKEPLTRQGMHVIFQKYKNQIGLSNLSHKTLVRTGIYMFGDPSQPKHLLQTPQTPLP